jgi:hypothetical protein
LLLSRDVDEDTVPVSGAVTLDESGDIAEPTDGAIARDHPVLEIERRAGSVGLNVLLRNTFGVVLV